MSGKCSPGGNKDKVQTDANLVESTATEEADELKAEASEPQE